MPSAPKQLANYRPKSKNKQERKPHQALKASKLQETGNCSDVSLKSGLKKTGITRPTKFTQKMALAPNVL